MTISQKNKDIKELCAFIQSLPAGRADVGPLTMQLSGVIDAAVQGGVNKYREAFFDGSYLAEFPDHENFVGLFKQALNEQMVTLKEGMDVFGSNCADKLRPLFEHLSDYYAKMQSELAPLLR